MIRTFSAAYRNYLPTMAASALDRFLERDWFSTEPTLINTNLVSVAALETFRSEFEYLIHDTELEARNRIELAFEHLRRQIAVDEDIRDKWRKKYGVTTTGETSCEKLGAVHLLNHGILAFKITGQGSATDLVYNEPLDLDSPAVRLAARALVLTEWKVIRKAADAHTNADAAVRQTRTYAGGVLGNTELTRTRYIVLVSDQEFDLPGDFEKDGIRYRHIEIPLCPLSPSVAARKGAATAARKDKR